MTAPGFGTFGFADNVYPVTSSTANTSLQDIDGVVFQLLDFNAWAINFYLGARWAAECNRIGRPDLSQIVTQTLPYNPAPYLQESNFTFPLLALYRAGKGKASEWTIGWQRVDTPLELVWIMPPITAAEAEVLMPFQKAVIDVVLNRNERGFDPNYIRPWLSADDGYSVGASAGLDYLVPGSFEYMLLPGIQTNLVMPTIMVTLSLTERSMPIEDQWTPFDGVDGYQTLVASPNDTPPSNLLFNQTKTNLR